MLKSLSDLPGSLMVKVWSNPLPSRWLSRAVGLSSSPTFTVGAPSRSRISTVTGALPSNVAGEPYLHSTLNWYELRDEKLGMFLNRTLTRWGLSPPVQMMPLPDRHVSIVNWPACGPDRLHVPLPEFAGRPCNV